MSNNIYTKLPREYTFFIEDAVQDEYIHNRYYFKYPKEWKTNLNREPIIGIRQIYIPRAYRVLKYKFTIEKYDIRSGVCPEFPTYQFTFDATSYLDNTKDLREVYKDFIGGFARELEFAGETHFKPSDVKFDFAYEINPLYNRLSYVEIIELNTAVLDQDYEYRIEIFNVNDDFEAVLNFEEDAENPNVDYPNRIIPYTAITPQCIKFYDVWDRHDSMVCASFCQLNRRLYLGFSEEKYNPIKYYKLNSNTEGFWVEFWNSRNKECPNVLPFDNKEGLIIEAILLESGTEIYD